MKTLALESLWRKFDVILLKTNHRQGEDKEYAEILNRIRVGEINSSDIEKLNERVRKENDPSIPNNALVVTCKNVAVNIINEKKLAEIDNYE